MRKTMMMALALVLLVALLAFPVSAAGGSAALTSEKAAAGETVYLTLSIRDFGKADSIGVSVECGEGLSLDHKQSQWLPKALLSDVDGKNNAVWAVAEPEDVNGELMKLAVAVAEGTKSGSYEVTCTVIVNNGRDILGTVKATGTVAVGGSTEETTEATETPSKPTEKPTEATEAPSEPATKPTEKPTEATEAPSKPATKPTAKPAEKPAETEAVEATTQATTEPSTEATTVATETVETTAETTQATVEPTTESTEPQSTEGPKKPSGILWWVLALLIAALAFVVVKLLKKP